MALIVVLGAAFTVYGRLTTAETQLVGLDGSMTKVEISVSSLRGELTGLRLAVQSLADAVKALN